MKSYHRMLALAAFALFVTGAILLCSRPTRADENPVGAFQIACASLNGSNVKCATIDTRTGTIVQTRIFSYTGQD